MYYLNIFFFYSCLGHILENFIYKGIDSGILYGFWTPVYGIGSVIILFIYDKYIRKLKIRSLLKALILFISNAIILSIMELLGGILIEKTIGRTFWDYGNTVKYTSIKMALLWGLSSLLLVYIIHPLIKKIIKKIPKYITYILVLLFIIDIIVTYINIGNY